MPRYLYIFSYYTPEQRAQGSTVGQEFADESCEAVFIDADSAEQALGWGRQISEEFVHRLFADPGVSWATQNFAHWVEADPEREYPLDVLSRIKTVRCGDHPDFVRSQSR
jgi:hypothetical protein